MTCMVDLVTDNAPALRKERKCGAIALARAYQRLGQLQELESVWKRVRTIDRTGNWAAASYRLAGDAIDCGYESLAIKLKDIDVFLDGLSTVENLQVIACHRLRENSQAGHFSLLESVNRQSVEVWLNDRVGRRHYSRREFLDLWEQWNLGDEFRPRIVVAIWRPTTEDHLNKLGSDLEPMIPAELTCLRCGEFFSLRLLQRLFSEKFAKSGERGWEAVFCPRCDAAHR